MDYKAVIEEQIRELQKVQDNLIKRVEGREEDVCQVALTIAELAEQASHY
jgi:hypothetical protein